ncbi:MAG: hypothetical protein HY692_08935 [Cyanobacteria bacterium NC_groundwater_1444_Ag_S-0.65um_54_12]|nr:hypothetical protein [Cyanobacteria bacterium NC_groundwater_1444_Ag_S-0.65um_54_12]
MLKEQDDRLARLPGLDDQIADLNKRQLANSTRSGALTEMIRLAGENARLYDQEQALGKERLLLIQDTQNSNKKYTYDTLRALTADQLSESDQLFLQDYEAKLARISGLNTEIMDLNKLQADHSAQIKDLDVRPV